jgi:hypothetical protein
MFSAIVNATNSTQIYPNLPKFAQRQNFEIPPKIEILGFFKIKNFYIFPLEHVSTIWIFNPRIFHVLFLLSRNGLCMRISAYPLVEIDDFLKVPHLVWA